MLPGPASRMPQGTVLWFNARKGYGFIKPDDGGADIFVHVSDVVASGLRELTEGARLEFEPASHGDGRHYATRLKLAVDP